VLRRRELLLLGGAAAAAYGIGLGQGWDRRSRHGSRVWRMAFYQGSPQYRRLLVGQVPERLAQRLATLTEGRFRLELVDRSALSSSDILGLVNQGRSVQCGYVDVYYDKVLLPLIFAKAVPFGLTPREQTAWLWYTRKGDDRPFHQTVYPRLAVDGVRLDQLVSIPLTLTGGQMGGWFKREVNGAEDLRGLRMRIPGLGADVLNAFGVQTDFAINAGRVITADQIVPRLRDGRLDAAEWIGPYDDELLGLPSVARFYYTPGWWEPSTTNELMVSRRALAELPAGPLFLSARAGASGAWLKSRSVRRGVEREVLAYAHPQRLATQAQRQRGEHHRGELPPLAHARRVAEQEGAPHRRAAATPWSAPWRRAA
jgi:TRAP-type mannitol/chloroaromatic compound transport system substrate-binding protein